MERYRIENIVFSHTLFVIILFKLIPGILQTLLSMGTQRHLVLVPLLFEL